MQNFKQHILFILLTVFMSSVIWASGNPDLRKSPYPSVKSNIYNGAIPIDGPYVFHESGKIIVKHVNLENKSLQVSKVEYPSKNETPALQCGIDKSKMPGFEFNLRSQIKPPPAIYPQPIKLYAISDIEGEFEAFAKSLMAHKIIDQNYRWTYGKGHLVLNGDFFDRGINVTACLWLVYKLEQEAEAAGGRVHFIIGNHEEMNLRGDLRYLKNKYQVVADKIGLPYIQLYGKDTELGRWLRSKNAMEKIGSTIFVHGGISPALVSSGLSIKEINNIARSGYGLPQDKVKAMGASEATVFNTIDGPMWFRGYFQSQLDESAITIMLAKFSADCVVVGHTVVEEVCSYYNDKVIAIDVKHKQAIAANKCNALIIEKDKFYKANHTGGKSPIESGGKVIVGGKKPEPVATASSEVNIIKQQAQILQAVRENNIDYLKKHLKTDAEVNARYSTRKYTLLHYAIKNDKLEVAKLLLERGIDKELFYNNQTPLMYAIKNQSTPIINLLLAKGVDINKSNKEKQTAIFYVAKYGTVNNARLLIDKGAKTNLRDNNSLTPYDFAMKNENSAVANFLKSLR